MITLSQCKKNCAGRDFSGGPVVKTPYFHRAQVQSLVGQLSSHALRGMAKRKTTVVLEVRIMVAPDRGQHMGGASGELGMFPFLTWILVQAFVKNISCYKLTIHILCVSTYFPGLCTAESVHTEGWDWKGNYPRRQAGFLYLPRMSWILWLYPARAGSERGILGEQAGRGRVLLLMARLFCFILFCFCIRLCFYKSSQSFQSNSVSPTLVLVFFSS